MKGQPQTGKKSLSLSEKLACLDLMRTKLGVPLHNLQYDSDVMYGGF